MNMSAQDQKPRFSVDRLARPTLTFAESGQVLTETIEGITMPADYSFEVVNDYVHGIGVPFEHLQCLCLGMAGEVDRLREILMLVLKCDVSGGGVLAARSVAAAVLGPNAQAQGTDARSEAERGRSPGAPR